MKAFLLRVKDIVHNACVNITAAIIIVPIAVGFAIFIAGQCGYYYVKAKVRGAVSWVANKYNTLIAKFKTEVAE